MPVLNAPLPWVVAIAPSPALITPLSGILFFTPLSLNKFPNKLAHNVPNSMSRNAAFLSFASILIVSLTPFISKTGS